ncbi:MAG: EamA family transporter, partial [Candidatus Daviesbacteria bacterium]|nr:EamA family transporter [Candidatus Daviesbacteria bacterium]
MIYLPIALIGYFLLSIAILIDKAILDRDIPNPIVYTFYLGLLSFISLLLIPFGFSLPSGSALIFGFLSGVYFTCAWVFYYKALRIDEASKLSPISGTLNPIFTILLGFLLLGQTTTQNQLYAFLVLVLGMIILNFNQLFGQKIRGVHLGLAVGAAFFFAASAVFLKEAFLSSNFITGLVISRVSVGISVL